MPDPPSADTPLRVCPKCGATTDRAVCPSDGVATVSIVTDGPKTRVDVGQIIAGKYRLTRPLGRGGFGAVFEANNIATEHSVALKVVHPEGVTSVNGIRRFFQEAAVTSRLTHPNTVRVFDFGQTPDGTLYLVMEHLRGESLEGRIKGHNRNGTLMTEREAVRIAIAILRSLGEAHDANLVHRDLKPANIFLCPMRDEEEIVKVLDFGIAHVPDSNLTATGTALGTPSFMSPEQCRGENLDGRSDLYAVGLILFQCLTGRLPFVSDNPMVLVQAHAFQPAPDVRSMGSGQVSDAVAEVIEIALAKYSDERYATARDMRAALEAAAGGAWAPTPQRMVVGATTAVAGMDAMTTEAGMALSTRRVTAPGAPAAARTRPGTSQSGLQRAVAPQAPRRAGVTLDIDVVGPTEERSETPMYAQQPARAQAATVADVMPARKNAAVMWAVAGAVALTVAGGALAYLTRGGPPAAPSPPLAAPAGSVQAAAADPAPAALTPPPPPPPAAAPATAGVNAAAAASVPTPAVAPAAVAPSAKLEAAFARLRARVAQLRNDRVELEAGAERAAAVLKRLGASDGKAWADDALAKAIEGGLSADEEARVMKMWNEELVPSAHLLQSALAAHRAAAQRPAPPAAAPAHRPAPAPPAAPKKGYLPP